MMNVVMAKAVRTVAFGAVVETDAGRRYYFDPAHVPHFIVERFVNGEFSGASMLTRLPTTSWARENRTEIVYNVEIPLGIADRLNG